MFASFASYRFSANVQAFPSLDGSMFIPSFRFSLFPEAYETRQPTHAKQQKP
jgi:hypothetical protein